MHRIKEFDLDRQARILDFGCGDGLDLMCFDHLGYKYVVGIDYSEDLLRGCSSRLVAVGDCERVPFADCSFDVVFVNSVLHHLVLEKALSEIRRLLRPGGRLCVIEPRPGPARWLLDFVTLSPLGLLIPNRQIRKRRVALQIELHEYCAWLRAYPLLVNTLQQHGFRVTFHRNTLFSALLGCERA